MRTGGSVETGKRDLLERYAEPLKRCGFRRLQVNRVPASFTSFYDNIPFRYPLLFEALCLSHSWEHAVVGEVEFAANPPGVDLEGLATSVRYDRYLWDYLATHGHLILGRMSGGRYDPCAFNMARRKGRDAPLVRVDHEEILSFQRLGNPTLLAASFGALLEKHLAHVDV
jgi:hypothetical protein